MAKSSKKKETSVSVAKLSIEHVKEYVPIRLKDPDGVLVYINSKEDDPWRTVVSILLSVLAYVHNGNVPNGLKKCKIDTPRLVVYGEPLKIAYSSDSRFATLQCSKIQNSEYYMASALELDEYPKVIKELCKACKFRQTSFKIELTPRPVKYITTLNKQQEQN